MTVKASLSLEPAKTCRWLVLRADSVGLLKAFSPYAVLTGSPSFPLLALPARSGGAELYDPAQAGLLDQGSEGGASALNKGICGGTLLRE